MFQNRKVDACFALSVVGVAAAFLLASSWRQTVATDAPPAAPPVQAAAVTPLFDYKAAPPRHADFKGEIPGDDARRVADWAIDSGDNRNAPYLIIDKRAARAYAFDANGRLLGAAPILLGLARGDDTPPGIGDKPLSAISQSQRITGAGRYVGELGYNLHGSDVLWVDYDAGLSLHRVLTSNPKEQRAQRLATPGIEDNRISYGCINVPVPFFEQVVRRAWHDTKGIVYVLPETRPVETAFNLYDVDERARRDASAQRAMQAATINRVR